MKEYFQTCLCSNFNVSAGSRPDNRMLYCASDTKAKKCVSYSFPPLTREKLGHSSCIYYYSRFRNMYKWVIMIVSPVSTSIDFKHGLRDALIDFLADNDPRIARCCWKSNRGNTEKRNFVTLGEIKKKKKDIFFLLVYVCVCILRVLDRL